MSGDAAGKAKRARAYGRGMTRGAILTALAIAAIKFGRRDGRWIWEKRADPPRHFPDSPLGSD